MIHADHVDLIRDGVSGSGSVWADFGSGSGAFTFALADLLGTDGHIYSVDQNSGALRDQAVAMRRQFPETQLHQIHGDFTQRIRLPPLDGVVAANALHFVRDQVAVLKLVRETLKPGGRLVVVEYNTDRGNQWVPNPFSFTTFVLLAEGAGFDGARQLSSRPGRFLDGMYAAVAFRVDSQTAIQATYPNNFQHLSEINH